MAGSWSAPFVRRRPAASELSLPDLTRSPSRSHEVPASAKSDWRDPMLTQSFGLCHRGSTEPMGHCALLTFPSRRVCVAAPCCMMLMAPFSEAHHGRVDDNKPGRDTGDDMAPAVGSDVGIPSGSGFRP